MNLSGLIVDAASRFDESAMSSGEVTFSDDGVAQRPTKPFQLRWAEPLGPAKNERLPTMSRLTTPTYHTPSSSSGL